VAAFWGSNEESYGVVVYIKIVLVSAIISFPSPKHTNIIA